MKRWKRQTRLAVIAAASFVLIVTVLPQLASGFGLGALATRLESVTTNCSGSSGSSGSSGPTPTTITPNIVAGSGSSGGSSTIGSGSSGSSGSSSTGGSSGSSGSSSSGCTPAPGTVTGTITVTGAPAGFTPAYEGIGLCLTPVTTGNGCSDPDDALASGGVYTLSLPVGSYSVSGFYENNAYGGAFLGAGQTITITSGATITVNLTVPYKAPSAITGTVAVTGLPSGSTVQQLSALLCPSYAPYNGTTASIACVNAYPQAETPGSTSATYSISGLPPIQWTVYPSYCTQYGCETNAHDGKTVTLAPGATSTVNVTASYIVPADGLLSATVSVTGAPAGTSDTVAFTTCPSGASTTSCQTFYGTPGSATSFILANGVWVVTPYYLASPFDNAVPGPSESVTITGGRTTTVSLSVAYRVPGTAAGSIDVTGAPANIPITSYTVVACPASAPLSVNNPSLECASEYSGPAGFGFGAADRTAKTANAQPVPVTIAPVTAGSATPASQAPAGYQGPASAPYDVYQITSLTPGKWLLYPGYQTELGSYTATVGTPVTVVAGHKVTHTLFVPYQHPMVGAVAGQVVVLDAPANGYEAGVEACTAIPTASSCPGEQEAFVASGGAYELDLAPGVWWLSGFVDEFGVLGQSQLVSAPRQVTVAAGSILTETFVVQGS